MEEHHRELPKMGSAQTSKSRYELASVMVLPLLQCIISYPLKCLFHHSSPCTGDSVSVYVHV